MNGVDNPVVLNLIDSLAIGGAERMAVNICNALQEQGQRVHLCATRAGGPLTDFISPGVSYLMLGRKNILDLAALWRLARYIRKNRISIVHAHSSSFFLAVLVKFITGVHVVWHDHYGGSENLAKRPRVVLRYCSIFFSLIFVVNQNLRSWNSKNLLLPKKKVIYLPNFPSLKIPSKLDIKLPGKKEFRIVCAARLNKQKDHHTLVRSMKLVNADFPEAMLLLVGQDLNDEYSRSVKSLITELSLEKCIHILGARTDMADILSECSIGVLSSRSEGLPVSLLEYGLAGLAVVCTDVGECAEVLKAGKYGNLVKPSESVAISEAIIEFLENNSIRIKKATLFNLHVRSDYSAESVSKKIIKVYQEFIK